MDPEEEINNPNGGINTEEDLFKIMNEGLDELDDDDDDESLVPLEFDDEFEEEENEDEDEDEEEEEEKSIFDEDEDEDEDEVDLSQAELDSFNKKLGTDFKTVEDLKNSFKKKDSEDENEKEEQQYILLKDKSELFDRYIEMDNKTLIHNQLISQAVNAKKDINDEDVLEEIKEKLQGLKDLDQLDSMAESLRNNLQNQKEVNQKSIDLIENKKIEKENAISRKNTDDLQNALSSIFDEKTFYGVTVSKEDVLEVYEDIRNNKFFNSINNDQEMIAKFAMFVKKEKEISKIANSPTHSDKTKGAFEFFSQKEKKGARSIASARSGSASSSNANDNLMNFIK